MIEQAEKSKATNQIKRHIGIDSKVYQRLDKYITKHYHNHRALSMIIGLAIEEYLIKHDIKE
jgi:hypothetical protein